MLIRGLSDSARTLLWTCVVIFFVTYVFSIFGLVMVVTNLLDEKTRLLETSSDSPDIQRLDDLLQITGGLDRMMYTLIQVLTEDSFHAFMREILVFVPYSWLYFYCYMAVACFVLMNLVTAIIVENAMQSSQNDREHMLQEKASKQNKDLRELKNLFTLMDADGSGTLSWAEFQESFGDEQMCKKWMLLDFLPEECKELFSLLDDGDGEIETNEFFEGLTRMKGHAQSKDLYRLQKCIYKMQDSLEELSQEFAGPGPVQSPRSRTPNVS